MQDNFAKFRKKAWRDIYLKCALVGVSSAAFCVGVILLALKLAGENLLFSLAGLAGLLAGVVLYFVLRTDDLQIAKRLDRELNLGEKAQTMVAYRGQEGAVLEMQRQDAERTLGLYSAKQLKFSRFWTYVVAGVVALALMVTSVAIPKKAQAEEEPPPIHEVTDWEWQALDDLINYVNRRTDASADMRTGTIDELEKLRALLVNQQVNENSLNAFVTMTANAIRNITQSVNADGVPASQQEINNEVCNYVVKTLYEIFNFTAPPEKEETSSDNNETPSEESGGSGGGGLSVGADETVFDPAKGYVLYKEVIDRYSGDIDRAIAEGVISREEWESYYEAYFNYLYGIDQ